MDSGDKATNKAMAIAMKYALFQVFCIPTDEMKDPDGETPPEIIPQDVKISTTKVQSLEKAIRDKNISSDRVAEVLKKFNYKTISDITIANAKAVYDELTKEE